jgi:hypothetical protein
MCRNKLIAHPRSAYHPSAGWISHVICGPSRGHFRIFLFLGIFQNSVFFGKLNQYLRLLTLAFTRRYV